MTPATGEILAHVSLHWVPALILFLFVFPGFLVLAGIAIFNECREDARQKAEFDRLLVSLLKFSLAAGPADRTRPWRDVTIALTLRGDRPRLLYQQKSARALSGAGQRLTGFILAYHYVRNPLFRLGGVHPDRIRTERSIRRYVFEQKWHVPVFIADEG